MVFISKKENKRQSKVAKRIFKRTGQRVGFAAGSGGTPFRAIIPNDPSGGSVIVRVPPSSRTSDPIAVPQRTLSQSGTTRREIQISEGKKGDLFCEIKIIKGKRKRVCKVKTTDKKRKKPIRVSRSVDKQFGFFGRIL